MLLLQALEFSLTDRDHWTAKRFRVSHHGPPFSPRHYKGSDVHCCLEKLALKLNWQGVF